MAVPAINKNKLDVAQIFQAYVAFMGDASRVAVALNLDVVSVRELARVENWDARIKEWNEIKTGDMREVQIQINRAINYVQATRLRSILDKMISHLSEKDADELENLLTKTTKAGSEFSARPLTDLVKAAEAAQIMTQRALGDTASERPDDGEGGKKSDIAMMVLAAMNAADAIGLDSVEVVRKELAAPPKPIKADDDSTTG